MIYKTLHRKLTIKQHEPHKWLYCFDRNDITEILLKVGKNTIKSFQSECFYETPISTICKGTYNIPLTTKTLI